MNENDINTYFKYQPNVFLAKCSKEYKKGDVIEVVTQYGKVNNSIVFNLIAEKNGFYYYSIVREDGFNTQEWAKRRAERILNASVNAENKSNEYYKRSKKDSSFLSLGEPVKVGHHSEKRHRRILEEYDNNMRKCVEFDNKSKEYQDRLSYWENKASTINLSMPESLEYYEVMLEDAKNKHQDLKNNPEKRKHSYSLTYAKKEVNELEKKLELAKKLWS